MSSYVSAIRSAPASADDDICAVGTVNYTVGSGLTPNNDENVHDDLTELSADIFSDSIQDMGFCVTITFAEGSAPFVGQTLEIHAAYSNFPQVVIEGNGVTLEGTNNRLIVSELFVDDDDDPSTMSTYNADLLYVNEVEFVNGRAGRTLNGRDGNGGAIYTSGDLDVSASSFSFNTSEGSGGAIYAAGDVSVNGFSEFIDNLAGGEGGAIDALGNVALYDITFTGNEAGADGGAIDAGNSIIEGSGAVTVYRSTFTDNNAGLSGSGDGGAINSRGDVSVLQPSSFVGNTTSDDGGAIDADYSVYVEKSTFTSNEAGDDGGAISAANGVDSWSSSFSSNIAVDEGGAIQNASSGNNGLVWVESSTFEGNQADLGGAVFGENLGVRSVNSTYFSNAAVTDGGAIYAETVGQVYAYFNTFLDNSILENMITSDPSVPSSISSSVDLPVYLGVLGNVFASSTSSSDHIDVFDIDRDAEITYVEYNLFTGERSDSESTNSLVTFSELGLATSLADNGGDTETLRISRTSAAVNFVPREEFASLVSTSEDTGPVDQRGEDRIEALDAGAFEFVASPPSPNGNAATPTFFVFDAKPVNTKPGTVVKITGANLTKVTEVYVGGVKVTLTKQKDASFTFKAPAGLTGLVDIRFVGVGYQYVMTGALNFSSTSVVGDKAKTVVPGFAANSTKLTRPMKKAIRAFVKANPDLTTVTCKGFTSAPATARDLRLARDRGKVTCDFIKKLNPDLTVEVLAGSHTDTPGQQIRRVRIVMQ
jgi:predicted outer membrane repeat protein